MIDIEVLNKDIMEIKGCTQNEYNFLLSICNKPAKGFQFTPGFRRGVWDGKINIIKGKYIPTNLYKYIIKCCEGNNFQIKISNTEFLIDNELKFDEFNNWVENAFKDLKFKPRDYQISAAFDMLKNKVCIAQLATSAGKTLISYIVFYYLLTHPKYKIGKCLMIVPSIQLVTQSTKDFIEYNENNNEFNSMNIMEVMSGVKPVDNPNIIIGTFQSLVKKPVDFFEDINCIIVDECHRATNSSIIKTVQKCKNAIYKFGLSGTVPNTKFADGVTLISQLGSIVTDVKAAQLQDDGYISNCSITQLRLNYVDDEMKERLKQSRKLARSSNRGVMMFNTEKKIVIDSEPRLVLLGKLINGAKRNSMVLFQHVDYGKKIFRYLKETTNKQIYFIDGSIDKVMREEIRQRCEVKNDVVMVFSFGTSATGLSINNIFNIFFTESYKSPTTVLQSIGRGLRMDESIGKEKVKIIDICDDLGSDSYMIKHGKERLKLYEEQNFPYDIKYLDLLKAKL